MRVENLSRLSQRRWTSFTLPASWLFQGTTPIVTGMTGWTTRAWPWVVGRRRGDVFDCYLRADMGPREVAFVDARNQMIPGAVGDLGPGIDRRFLDGGQPGFDLVVVGEPGERSVPMAFDRVEQAHGPMIVLRLRGSVAGWHCVAYAEIGAGCGVANLFGTVVWSDRSTPRLETPHYTGIRLRTRSGDALCMDVAPMDRAGACHAGQVGDGMGIWWRGAMVAITQGPQILAEDDVVAAASEGPIVAIAGHEHEVAGWGPSRATPIDLFPVAWEPVELGRWNDGNDDWAGRRAFGNNVDTGSSGDQGCFGVTKATEFLRDRQDGLGARFMALQWSAADLWSRAFHHRSADGLVIGPPMGGQYNGHVHAPRLAEWGKDSPAPYGWGAGRAYRSVQHRANLYPPAASILSADPTQVDLLADLLLSDGEYVRHYAQGQDRWEASRASGRLLLEWAWWWVSAGEAARDMIDDLVASEIDTLMGRRCGDPTAGPCRPAESFPVGEKNPLTKPAWAPWQEAILCDGLLAWLDIWGGDAARNAAKIQRARTLALAIGNTVLRCGIVRSGTIIHFGGWVALPPHGQDHPPGYLTYPRAGAGSAIGTPGMDLLVGGISPFWYAGAFEAVQRLGTALDRSYAKQVWVEAGLDRPVTRDQYEWVAGRSIQASLR